MKIGVLSSENSYDIQNLIDTQKNHEKLFSLQLLISDKKEVVDRNKNRIKSLLIGDDLQDIPRRTPIFHEKISNQILEISKSNRLDILILDGFYIILVDPLISAFQGRILNVHPSLLPKYGGKGMFGYHVHDAVLASKETVSGVTVHLVDSGIDSGEILSQAQVEVSKDETSESLAKKISSIEGNAIIEALLKLKDRM